MTEFQTDEFNLSCKLSATAMKTGISENLNYNNSVIAIVMPKAGLMADASVGGQRFKYTPFEK